MADSKGKKAKSEEDDGQQQPELVLNIQKLQDLQEDLEKINEEATDKVVEIEQKYSEIRRPVYQKRNEIIQGIPDFWLTAFLSHPALCEMLTDADRQVFKYLHLLDVEDFKDVKAGYSISFIFRPNPYFEDTKLVKVFRFSDEGTTSISGTQPRWKDGMDPTNVSTQEKEGNKRMFAEESFFKWFTDTQLRDDSEGTHDEIAEIIKEDLWPNPLKYFNNDPDDEFDDEDEDEEDDGEFQENGADGSEDDDDNNDDDEDDPNE